MIKRQNHFTTDNWLDDMVNDFRANMNDISIKADMRIRQFPNVLKKVFIEEKKRWHFDQV